MISLMLWEFAGFFAYLFGLKMGVRAQQVWEYPDQAGWFRVDSVRGYATMAVLTPVEGGDTPTVERRQAEILCLTLFRLGRKVPLDEIEADAVLRGDQ